MRTLLATGSLSAALLLWACLGEDPTPGTSDASDAGTTGASSGGSGDGGASSSASSTSSSASSSGASSTSSGSTGSSGSTSSGGVAGKRVFVTKQTFTADLGGITGADDKCAAAAAAANLPGTFKAWLSVGTGTGPVNRFTPSADGYVRTDGLRVAASWNKLLDTSTTPLEHPINRDEYGADIGTETEVWSNTVAGDTYLDGSANCSAFASTNGTTWIGDASKLDEKWTNLALFKPCSQTRRLYCFEQ